MCWQLQRHPGPSLDSLEIGRAVGVLIDHDFSLHLYVDGVDVGVVARSVAAERCYAVVDVYGQCEQVSVVGVDGENARLNAAFGTQEHQEKADKEDGSYAADEVFPNLTFARN